MEKNKLITQSIVQAKLTPAQAAERFGVSRRWVYELMRRHRALGEDGYFHAPSARIPARNRPRKRCAHASCRCVVNSRRRALMPGRRPLPDS
ncbi:helix-turn-helix domain-containing protein [Arthrobacter sp. TMN-49]